jgi:transcriptional regulator with XRE-family HTH domain
LRAFREEHELSHAEVARAIGASRPSISRWEAGSGVPEGLRVDRLRQLLAGELWPEIRASVIGRVDGLPHTWRDAVRWYRRASREVSNRVLWGSFLASELELLRSVNQVARLRARYAGDAGPWSISLNRKLPPALSPRLLVDVTYGLRWLEIVHGHLLDPNQSLIRPIPSTWLVLPLAGDEDIAAHSVHAPAVETALNPAPTRESAEIVEVTATGATSGGRPS